MRTLTFSLAMIWALNAHADLGGCVVYKAKFVLKNGQTITGQLPLLSYSDWSYLDEATQTNRYCNDVEFQKLLNKVFYEQQKTLDFQIYKQIYLVNLGQSANQKDSPRLNDLAFTDSSSIVHLNLDSLKYTIFLSAKNADWQFIETSIKVVDAETCRMMQTKAVVNHTFLSHKDVAETPTYIHGFDFYYVLNYNPEISLSQLNKMMESIAPRFYKPDLDRIRSKKKTSADKFEAQKKRIIDPIVEELRQKGIILYHSKSTC